MYGAKTCVYSDDKDLTRLSTARTSARVQRHRLLLEELGCTVLHTSGEKNELADILSRSPMTDLYEEQEVKELNLLRKAREDTENLPETLAAI